MDSVKRVEIHAYTDLSQFDGERVRVRRQMVGNDHIDVHVGRLSSPFHCDPERGEFMRGVVSTIDMEAMGDRPRSLTSLFLPYGSTIDILAQEGASGTSST
jgi:hypothetical protein